MLTISYKSNNKIVSFNHYNLTKRLSTEILDNVEKFSADGDELEIIAEVYNKNLPYYTKGSREYNAYGETAKMILGNLNFPTK
jgi:hypothetical protein